MDTTATQEIVKKPHTFDPVTGAYKELTKEPDPFYPKCKYAAPQGAEPYRAVVVNNPVEEKELGPGWYDHHNQIPKPRIGGMAQVIRQTEEDLKATTGVFDPSLKKRRGRRPKAVEPTPEPE